MGTLENSNRLIYEAFRGFRSHAYATREKMAKQDKRVLLTPLPLCSVSIADKPSRVASQHAHPLRSFAAPGLLLRVSTPFRRLPFRSRCRVLILQEMPLSMINHGRKACALKKAGPLLCKPDGIPILSSACLPLAWPDGQAGQSYETKQNHKKGGAYYESGGQGLY